MNCSNRHHIRVLLSFISTFGLAQACSSNDTRAVSAGGATGTYGADEAQGGASVGGSSATGSSSQTSSTSTTGGAIGRDCTPSSTVLAPSDGLIASFSDVDGGMEFAKRTIEYPFDASAPKVTIDAGSLHITQNAPATSSNQYTGVAIGFGHCVDATAFTGVEFSISGSVSGCTMKYFSGDVAHQDSTTGAAYATGAAGAYQPQSPITSSQLSTAPATLRMPFNGYAFAGEPQTPLDVGKIILLGWQFDIEASAAGSNCVADITIDDVRFY